MTKQFIIKKVCNEENRPPYSHKIDEYFEDFVIQYILEPFNLIVDTDWKTVLSIMIFKKEPGAPEGVSFYEATSIDKELVTFYPVSITLDDIYVNDEPLQNIVGLYFQIISLFIIANYKSISKEYMVSLKDKIDWDYLLALPYPAPFHEQKYVGD